jgi:hypothetical protein
LCAERGFAYDRDFTTQQMDERSIRQLADQIAQSPRFQTWRRDDRAAMAYDVAKMILHSEGLNQDDAEDAARRVQRLVMFEQAKGADSLSTQDR